jgi:hypothetical protein
MEWQCAEQSIDNNIYMVADQQKLDNAHALQWLFMEYPQHPQDSYVTNSTCCCQLSHTDTWE